MKHRIDSPHNTPPPPVGPPGDGQDITPPVPAAGGGEGMTAAAKAVGYGPGVPDGPAETCRDIERIIYTRLGWER